MKKCVQTKNIFGYSLGEEWGECWLDSGGSVHFDPRSDRVNEHRNYCADTRRCPAHVYLPEDEFLTFAKKVINEKTHNRR